MRRCQHCSEQKLDIKYTISEEWLCLSCDKKREQTLREERLASERAKSVESHVTSPNNALTASQPPTSEAYQTPVNHSMPQVPKPGRCQAIYLRHRRGTMSLGHLRASDTAIVTLPAQLHSMRRHRNTASQAASTARAKMRAICCVAANVENGTILNVWNYQKTK